MKVLLVIPKTIGRYIKPTVPHAGIGYIASILLKNNHNVEILDMRVHPHIKDLFKKINTFKPDMVGLTSPSRGYMIAYNLIREIKKQYNIPIIIGGPHASTIEEQILEDTPADYAVMGEGEYTILDLVNEVYPSKIKGLMWRDKGKIVKNPYRDWIEDLDSLPFPTYGKFEVDQLIERRIPIVSSRGCPFLCNFCLAYKVMGRKFRKRSAENVVAEIEHWYKQGFKEFEFSDDNFTFDIERAEKICDLIIAKKLKIKFLLGNGIRVDRVDENLLRKMKKAGCTFIAYGVEAINENVLKLMKKGISKDKVTKAIIMTHKLGIQTQANFIIGCAGDTFKTFKEALEYSKILPVDEVRFNNMIPYPGTELYDWVKKNGTFLYPPEYYLNNISSREEGIDIIFETKDFTKEERYRAYKIGEKRVMELLIKRHFGNFFGTIAFKIWDNNLIKKYCMTPIIIPLWCQIKKIKKNIA